MVQDDRLSRLERGLRRSKAFSLLLLVVLVAHVWMTHVAGSDANQAQAAPAPGAGKEVRAKRFVVEDAKGRERAILQSDEGMTTLRFYTPAGSPHAVLGATDSGDASLCFQDTEPRMALSFTKNGPAMSFMGAKGEPLLALLADRIGPSLRLSDGKGTLRVSAEVSEKYGPCVRVCDADGKDRAVVGAFPLDAGHGRTLNCPESSLLLFGQDGKTSWSAP